MARRAASRESGIAAIFAAVSLVTLLSALALAIDVGRLYYAQRDLQRLADAAAMDAARLNSQCIGVAKEGDVTAEAIESLKRNGGGDIQNPAVKLGTRVPVPGQDQQFVPAAAAVADSVQVAISRESPARILPLFQGDSARTMKAQAAAIAHAVANPSTTVADPTSIDPAFANAYYGGQLGGSVGLSASQYATSINTNVQVNKVVSIAGSATEGVNLPDINQPITTLGLLSQIAAALDAQGDSAVAAAVQAFAAGLDAGHAATTVVPSQLLGLPPDAAPSTYDGATVPVGNLLNSIAAAATAGNPFTFPINLPAPLGDVTTTVQISQPQMPGSTGDGSSSTETSQSSSDAVSHGGALVSFEFNVLDPASGLPVKIKTHFTAVSVTTATTGIRCARLGQPDHIVFVRATTPVTTFALGDLPPLPSYGGDVLDLINKVTPAEVLKLNVLGQAVGITASIPPTTLGAAGSETFCFQGPPWGQPVQCDGSPAYAGSLDSRDVASVVQGAAVNLQLSAKLPDNLPLGLGQAIEGTLNPQLADLTKLLQQQLGLLVGQLVPQLDSVHLQLGAVPVVVSSVTVTQPTIFAR